MPHTIAVAGKGGVGKTTTCGMLIDYLTKKNQGPFYGCFKISKSLWFLKSQGNGPEDTENVN